MNHLCFEVLIRERELPGRDLLVPPPRNQLCRGPRLRGGPARPRPKGPLMTPPAIAPVRRGNPILGSLLDMRRDRIAFFEQLAGTYGDVVRTRMGLARLVVVASPELAHEALVEQADAFMKGFGLSIFARPLLGNGLLTS